MNSPITGNAGNAMTRDAGTKTVARLPVRAG